MATEIIRKGAGAGALYKLLLPRLYLVRMHFEAFCEFGQRAIAAHGGKGYLRLERRTVGSACSSRHGSRLVDWVGTRSQHYTLNSAKICPINPDHLSRLSPL